LKFRKRQRPHAADAGGGRLRPQLRMRAGVVDDFSRMQRRLPRARFEISNNSAVHRDLGFGAGGALTLGIDREIAETDFSPRRTSPSAT